MTHNFTRWKTLINLRNNCNNFKRIEANQNDNYIESLY